MIIDDGTTLVGRIVEVEAYLGGEDKAAHSYQNRVTEKNRSMFLDAGYSYIYKSFRGHANCFNITSDELVASSSFVIEPLTCQKGGDSSGGLGAGSRTHRRSSRHDC